MARKSWIQDPKTGKLIPKEEWRGARHDYAIQGDIEPFVSPIDGSHITSRSHLRAHNHRHGVTDSRDYSDDFLVKRSQQRVAEMTGQTPASKRERINLIKEALQKHGSI